MTSRSINHEAVQQSKRRVRRRADELNETLLAFLRARERAAHRDYMNTGREKSPDLSDRGLGKFFNLGVNPPTKAND